MSANDIIQLLGILYFVIGLAFLINRKFYKKLFKDMVKSRPFMFIGGYIALIIGFVIILFFREITPSKEGLIAILGWIALIKGISILLFPDFMVKFIKAFLKETNLNGIAILIMLLGVLFLYAGFLA